MPRKNTHLTAYPAAVLHHIEQLAQHIVIARKRRGETQAQWAQKLGISQPTMARVERGDPAVAMVTYAMCIWLINPHHHLADAIAPAQDHTALEREIAKVRPQRTRTGTKNQATHTNDLVIPPQSLNTHPTNAQQAHDLLANARATLARPAHHNNPTALGLAALLLKPPTA